MSRGVFRIISKKAEGFVIAAVEEILTMYDSASGFRADIVDAITEYATMTEVFEGVFHVDTVATGGESVTASDVVEGAFHVGGLPSEDVFEASDVFEAILEPKPIE
jgi:hypothetical protein